MRRRMHSRFRCPQRSLVAMCEATFPKSYTCASTKLLIQASRWTDKFRRQGILEIHQEESPLATRDGRFLVEVHGCSKTWACFLVK